MQQLGYLKIDGKVIRVLARVVMMNKRGAKYDGFYVALKLRKSGKLGEELSDEALYLKGEPEKLSQLLEGKVVKC